MNNKENKYLVIPIQFLSDGTSIFHPDVDWEDETKTCVTDYNYATKLAKSFAQQCRYDYAIVEVKDVFRFNEAGKVRKFSRLDKMFEGE